MRVVEVTTGVLDLLVVEAGAISSQTSDLSFDVDNISTIWFNASRRSYKT